MVMTLDHGGKGEGRDGSQVQQSRAKGVKGYKRVASKQNVWIIQGRASGRGAAQALGLESCGLKVVYASHTQLQVGT